MEKRSFTINPQMDLIRLLEEEEKGKRGLQTIRKKTYRKEEYIYLSGEKATEIYIIINGRVKIENHNKTLITNVLMDGELFGEGAIIGEDHRVDHAKTMEATELYVLNMEELNDQMRYRSNLIAYAINILGTRLMAAEKKVESFILKNSRSRIIEFLYKLAHKRGQRVGYEVVVRNFFTHKEIADITATSRQTVTMVLNELRTKNILTFNRKRLLIRDLVLLKAQDPSLNTST